MKKILTKAVSDPVFIAAWVLAVFSAFFIHPDGEYREYIDWRSLGILWSLMIIIQGWKENGVFNRIGEGLLRMVKQGWQLAAVLVFLCFFSGMLITNDVALITFVPFAIMILKGCNREKMTLGVVVLQTIAANLGSMLTPIGNPQNLYLYGLTGMQLGDFLKKMFPYTAVSAVLLCGMIFFLPQKAEKLSIPQKMEDENDRQNKKEDKKQIFLYSILFVIALAAVLRILTWYFLVGIVFLAVLAVNKKILLRADYILLFTFAGFFIFTGNIGRISSVRNVLQDLVQGREVLISVLASQCISNVPAALLLSGFTNNHAALLAGVNIGGLGTLIASMASLISYKAFSNAYKEKKGRYVCVFSIISVGFLVILLVLDHLLAG